MSEVPGGVARWLRRATITDLRTAKADEVRNKPTLAVNWKLVAAIDEELTKRDRAQADEI